MAKKRGRRNRRNFVALPIEGTVAVNLLPAYEASADELTSSDYSEDLYLMSADLLISIRNVTAGEGPIEFGVCHSDVTQAQLAAYLNSSGNVDPDDLDAIALARWGKYIRRLGYLSCITSDETVNNGMMKRYKIKMKIGNDHQLYAWAFNRTNAQMSDAGNLLFNGTAYGRWLR